MVAAVCTVVVLVRPGADWPLIIAANRDERSDRAWDPPGSHWPEMPDLVAGRDRLGDGTWLAFRGSRFAAVLNRPGSLGPQAGKRSRGALPILALAGGCHAVESLPPSEYRTFNMVVAGPGGAWFLRNAGTGPIERRMLGPGLHMITAHDPNDPASPRVRRHLPRFAAARFPDPAVGAWQSWIGLLQDRSGPRGAAINVPLENGFGTVCSSVAAVSSDGRAVWSFAAGPPDEAPSQPVLLP